MAKCPHCKEEIDYLRAYSIEQNVQNLSLAGKELDWGVSEVVESTCTKIEFACSNCHEVIYQNDGDSTDSKIKELFQPKEVPEEYTN